MDMMLAKFLITCLLCQFIGLSAGLPVTDDKDPSEKQIPSISLNPTSNSANPDKILQVGLPYLSVSIPNPLPTVERIVATVGNLLASDNAVKTKDNLSPKFSENANNNEELSAAEANVQSDAVKQNIQSDNDNKVIKKAKDNTDAPSNNDEKKQIQNERAITDIDAGIMKPDNSLVDPVPIDFKEKVPAVVNASQPDTTKAGR